MSGENSGGGVKERAKGESWLARARRHHDLLAGVLTAVAGAVSFAAAVGGFHAYESEKGVKGDMVALRGAEQELRFKSVQADAARALEEAERSTRAVEGIARAKPADIQGAKLAARVDELELELKRLDDAVGQSPEKALSVPLLRKDVENLRDSYRHDLDTTQAEVGRLYDQNKWFIGLVVTMALALISLAVSNFLLLRKS